MAANPYADLIPDAPKQASEGNPYADLMPRAEIPNAPAPLGGDDGITTLAPVRATTGPEFAGMLRSVGLGDDAALPSVAPDFGLSPVIEGVDRYDPLTGNTVPLALDRNAAIAHYERMARDPAYNRAAQQAVADRYGATAVVGEALARPEVPLGERLGDAARAFRTAAREGVAGLADAPRLGINVVNTGVNKVADLYGLPQIEMMDRWGPVEALAESARTLGEEEALQTQSATSRYDQLNRPDTFTGALGYIAENPGVLAEDVAGTLGALSSTVVPGSATGTILTQATQQAAQTADAVEQSLLEKGVDPQTAKAQAAEAFTTAVAVSLAAQKLVPEGTRFEEILAGAGRPGTGSAVRALGQLGAEVASEGGEEGGIQATQNLYSGDPIGQGVGAATALGATLGFGQGAVPATIEALGDTPAQAPRRPAPPPAAPPAADARPSNEIQPTPGPSTAADQQQAAEPVPLGDDAALGELAPEVLAAAREALGLEPDAPLGDVVEGASTALGITGETPAPVLDRAALERALGDDPVPPPSSPPAQAEPPTARPQVPGGEEATIPAGPERILEELPAPRGEAQDLRAEVGWLERGGRILRERRDGDDDPTNFLQRNTGDVIGRTPWVGMPAPDGTESTFWRNRPDKLTEAQANTAFDKHARGEPLTKREQRFIDYAQETADGYAEAERELSEEIRAWDQAQQVRAVQDLRDRHRLEINEADGQEALAAYELARRAAAAGMDEVDVVQASNESDRAYAARLWNFIKEADRGADPGSTQEDRASGDRGREGGANVAAAPEPLELGAVEPAPAPARREVAPTQGGGLFGAPSAREVVDAETRRRDAERDGRTGTGRTDMAAGAGELFAGRRPEQADIESPPARPSRNTDGLESVESPFYSAAVRAIEEGRGAPKRGDADAWRGWLDGAVRRGDMKQAERDWLGIDDWLAQQDGPVTREALADFVRANEVQVQDVVLGDESADRRNARQRELLGRLESEFGVGAMDDGDGGFDWFALADNSTVTEWPGESDRLRDEFLELAADDLLIGGPVKFASYQLPGGENYRELLLTLPSDTPDRLEAPEYYNATTNDYRSSHFEQPNILAHVRFNERTDADGKRVLFLEEIQSDWHQAGRKRGYQGLSSSEQARKAALDAKPMQEWSEADVDWYNERVNDAQRDGVPDAPLKGTDEWSMLAFKRMVRWAAENGFERIAWTTGDQQNARYDLSKQVDSIDYAPTKAGTYNLQVYKDGRNVLNRNGITIGEVESLVGKEVASKIERGEATGYIPSSGYAQLSGLDLQVGGEGMRGFYDRILPKAVNKWAKRFGAQVGRADVTPDGSGEGAAPGRIGEQHAIDITPAMRDAALAGQPLFREEPGQQAPASSRTAAQSYSQGARDAERLGMKAAVDRALAGSSVKVEFLRGLEGLPLRLREGVERRLEQRGGVGRTAALYDPVDKRVFIFTDVVRTPERAVWNAAHEIAGHHGLREFLGDRLDRALEIALQNPTVEAVANAIALERQIDTKTQRGRMLAAEESLAELAAAARTGNWSEIESRYATPVSETMRERVTRAIDNFIKRLKALMEDIFGRPNFTDADVRELLEAAWQAANGKQEAQGDTIGGMGKAPDDNSTVRLYHGGNAGLVEIDGSVGPGNIFGGLFASADRASATSHGDGSMFYMDIPSDKLLTQSALDYDIAPDQVEAALRKAMPWLDDSDYDVAYQAVIEDRADQVDEAELVRVFREDSAGEASWEAQRIRGDVARRLGYSAVEMSDEHGTSYLVLPGTPVQSESATANRGTFDPESPSILESVGPSQQQRTGLQMAQDDVRRADVNPLDDDGVITAARKDIADQIEAARKFATGRPANPQSLVKRANKARAVFFDSVVSRSRSLLRRNPESKALRELFNRVMVLEPGGKRLASETLLEETQARFSRFTNRVRNIIADVYGNARLTEAQNDALRKAMLADGGTGNAKADAAAKRLRKLMDTETEDLRATGVEVGEVDDIGYLTRIYDETVILDDEAGFTAAAEKLYSGTEFALEVGTDGRSIMYGDGTLPLFISYAKRAAMDDPVVDKALADLAQEIKGYRNSGNVGGQNAKIMAIIDKVLPRVRKSYGQMNAAAWLHKIKTPTVSEVFNGVGPSGAPVTKARALSGAADTVMRDYMRTDMFDILDTFARTTSKKIAMAERFGPKGEKVQQLIDAASREGVPRHDLDEATQLMESALGTYSPVGDAAKGAIDAMQAWGVLSLLGRVAFSSLAEPITFAMRTGQARHALAPVVQLLNATVNRGRGRELREFATMIGVNGNKAMEDVIQNQLGGDYGMTPKYSALVQRFMQANLLTPLTRAQRAYGVGAAAGYLRWISKNVAAGRRVKEMGVYLTELGIADHQGFAEWMLAQGGLPAVTELYDESGRPTPRGQDFMVATRRMIDQTIQNPNAAHRPQWQNSPWGRVFGGIMGFSYAAYENVIKGEIRRINTLRTEAGNDAAIMRAGKTLFGAAALVIGQTLVSTLREALFSPQRFEDKDDEEIAEEMMTMGLQRSFGLGSLDPLVQLYTGLKYQRSVGQTILGAYLGTATKALDNFLGVAGGRNSENTDTAEYRAVESVYSAIITPVANAVLSRIPLVGWAGIMSASSGQARRAFAELFFDRPEAKTELDRKYTEMQAELTDLTDEVKDQLYLKPVDQWAQEFEALREQYPALLAGASLDVYKRDGRYGDKGEPKRDAQGRPVIRMESPDREEGSVMGELQGYPYWMTRDGKAKQAKTQGIEDRITALNKAIKQIRQADDLTLGAIATIIRDAPGELPVATELATRLDAGRPGALERGEALEPAPRSLRRDVLKELEEARRQEKRRALDVVERGRRGERIQRPGIRRAAIPEARRAEYVGIGAPGRGTTAPAVLEGAKNAPKMVMVGDWSGIPSKAIRDTLDDGALGVYDPSDRTAYVVMGLPEAEAKFVAYHEIAGHYGLQGALGDDYEAVLNRAMQNPTVDKLATAMTERAYGKGNRLERVEEALAELAAARRADDYDRIEQTWGVKVPTAGKSGVAGMVSRVVQMTKRKLADLTGEEPDAFDDDQVYSLIEDAWQYVKDGPAVE